MTRDGGRIDDPGGDLREPGTAASLSPGARLGRYVILNEVGEGGMGIVYSAYDAALDRKVALKLVSEKHTGSDESRDRLLREARSLARMSHPGVVSLFEAGTTEAGHVFIAMEFVDGMTLSEWVAGEAQTWREIVGVFLQAGEALAAIHEAGIVHRDFKLSNVVIDAAGRARVLDFGLAVRTTPRPTGTVESEPHTMVTPSGVVVGTPFYMAPEVVAGERGTARSDQFSFCSALEKAIAVQSESALQGVVGADNDATPTASTRSVPGLATAVRKASRRDVPRWLRRLIERGKSRRPDDRYPTMRALLGDLRRDPGKLARRVAIAVAACLVLVAGVAGYQYQRGQQRALCEEGAAELAVVWNGTIAGEIGERFEATGETHASKAWAAVSAHIDSWLSAWRQEYLRACEATHVERVQPAEVLALKLTCLGDRRSELKALVAILREVNSKRVAGSIDSAYSMQPAASCADVESLRAGLMPPSDSEMATRVAIARERLARSEKLRETDRSKEGLAIASEVRKEAEALGYRPLVAEAAFLEARGHEELGAFDMSLRLLRDAELHAEASDHDVLRSKALNRQAWVSGYKLNNLDEGDRLLAQNQALLERLGRFDLLVAAHETTRGALLSKQGRLRDSAAHLSRALELRERALGADATATMWARRNVALLEQMLGNYTFYLEQNQRLLSTAEARYGESHELVARLRNSVGEAMAEFGRYDEAYAMTTASLEAWRSIVGATLTEGFDTFDNLIPHALELGHVEEASAYAAEMWLVCAENPACKVIGLIARAVVALDAEDYELAARVAGQAYAIQRERGGGDPYVPRNLTYFARALRHLGRCNEVMEDLNEVAERTLAQTGPRSLPLNRLLYVLALCHLDLGNRDAAVDALQRSVAGQKEAGTDPVWLARSQFALARALEKSAPARARGLAEEARETLARHGQRAAGDREEVDAWLDSDLR